MGRLSQVSGLNGRLRHVEEEHEGRWHGRTVHVLHTGDEVTCSILEFGVLRNIFPLAIGIKGTKVVLLSLVDIFAEVAHPLLAAILELDEGVDVRAAVLAPDDALVVKVGRGDLFA